MIKKMGRRSFCSSMEVCGSSSLAFYCLNPNARALPGHTARPTDFCWAPGESENWTAASVSEDNVVMIWQPTMRVWAGEEVKIDEQELESDVEMEGVENTGSLRGGSSLGRGHSTATSVSGDD